MPELRDDQDNHNDVITHLEPDILEFEVKWALGSITMNKARGGDGITVLACWGMRAPETQPMLPAAGVSQARGAYIS